MTDNKIAYLMIFMLLFGIIVGFPFGFAVNDSIRMRVVEVEDFGGVRGGARTGFHLIAGEFIGIGTSSITYDIEVVSDSTSTLRLGEDLSSSNTGGCIILTDISGDGETYITVDAGVLTSSSTDICN